MAQAPLEDRQKFLSQCLQDSKGLLHVHGLLVSQAMELPYLTIFRINISLALSFFLKCKIYSLFLISVVCSHFLNYSKCITILSNNL